jgi:predicted acetyltransferase
MTGIEIRPIAPTEFGAFMNLFMRTMGFPPHDEKALEREIRAYDQSRSLAAFDGDQIVGTAHSFLFDLTLPGATVLPAAGVTDVSVATTHRRRGIVTELMRRQLVEARDRGEPLAILIASESAIYGRYGYGLASTIIDVTVDTRFGTLRSEISPPGRVRFVDEVTADKVFPEVYERHRASQPGAVPRHDVWWERWRDERKGDDSLAIYESPDGAVDGYVRYTVRAKWDGGLPDHSLHIHDHIALTVDATAALWRHCLSADLVRSVTAGARPIDEPLRWILANPRAMKVTRVGDLLWARLLDVPRALNARRYATDDEFVLEVVDDLFGTSDRFVLSAGTDGAACEPTQSAADVSMTVADLGAIYLGGTAPSELARVGRIREATAGAVTRLESCFASTPKPWSATWF